MNNMSLLKVNGLKTHFKKNNDIIYRMLRKGPLIVKAVDGISFEIEKQETMGLVGESGCGKSTVARSVLNLVRPFSGEVIFEGKNIFDFSDHEIFEFRKRAQLITQDPLSSLDPRQIIEEIIAEPMYIHKLYDSEERIALEVKNLLEIVGLSKKDALRFPHEFSGGQARRIGIARALALKPRLLICDEPTAGLDVSIMAAVLNLMNELQKEYALTFLWISHNLHVVRHISNNIGVMYLGKIVEKGNVEDIFNNPMHPYTKALFSSIPSVRKNREREAIKGDVPSPINPPPGCSFHPRCKFGKDGCKKSVPVLKLVENRYIACHSYN